MRSVHLVVWAALLVNGVQIDVFGQGWTRGTASVTGLDTGHPFLATVPTETFQRSDARSPRHAGHLVLVSPFQVVTNGAGTQAGFATLDLQFTPEPSSAARLASAGILVVWAARGRRRAQAASSPNCSSYRVR